MRNSIVETLGFFCHSSTSPAIEPSATNSLNLGSVDSAFSFAMCLLLVIFVDLTFTTLQIGAANKHIFIESRLFNQIHSI